MQISVEKPWFLSTVFAYHSGHCCGVFFIVWYRTWWTSVPGTRWCTRAHIHTLLFVLFVFVFCWFFVPFRRILNLNNMFEKTCWTTTTKTTNTNNPTNPSKPPTTSQITKFYWIFWCGGALAKFREAPLILHSSYLQMASDWLCRVGAFEGWGKWKTELFVYFLFMFTHEYVYLGWDIWKYVLLKLTLFWNSGQQI